MIKNVKLKIKCRLYHLDYDEEGKPPGSWVEGIEESPRSVMTDISHSEIKVSIPADMERIMTILSKRVGKTELKITVEGSYVIP